MSKTVPVLTAEERSKLEVLASVLYPPEHVTPKGVAGQVLGLVTASRLAGIDLPELLAALRVEWQMQEGFKS